MPPITLAVASHRSFSDQATRVWIPTLNKAKLAIDHIRVTFDDASGQSWQRIGNGPPVKK
jgi:hypothetical protein